jgi:drug/metabolite transporter (DMT)-like permease
VWYKGAATVAFTGVLLSARTRALLQGLLVTFLWATSWVLIKIGLQGDNGPAIPPLTFAGLRYSLAFLCLLPFAARPAQRAALRALPRAAWLRLVVLGLLFYSLTQPSQFVGLKYLPAITVNVLLNFSTIIVALLGLVLLAERPAPLQWLGMGVALAGALVFFYPGQLPAGHLPGYLAVGVGIFANAGAALLGRAVNRGGQLSALLITTVSMGIGAAVLLVVGLVLQGLPALSLQQWVIVAWLAVVNTAFAFTLWNHTQRTLSAIESSVINNTLIAQIPVLAWLFLGEALTVPKLAGLVLVGGGTLIVQLWGRRQQPSRAVPLERAAPGRPE